MAYGPRPSAYGLRTTAFGLRPTADVPADVRYISLDVPLDARYISICVYCNICIVWYFNTSAVLRAYLRHNCLRRQTGLSFAPL